MRAERAIWLGLLGAPLAWTAQLVVGYAAEEAYCATGSALRSFTSHTIDAVLFGVAGFVAVAGLAAAVWALRAAARLGDPHGRVLFMARAAVLVSSLFAALVLMTGIGVLSFEPCTAG